MMGVHGLTKFLSEYQKKYSEYIYLWNSPVVIDGNNLKFHLCMHNIHDCSYLLGGDLAAFGQNARNFFLSLQRAGIVPLVILDGAYENNGKIKTSINRLKETIRKNVRDYTPGAHCRACGFSQVFYEILVEQKITHFQAEFEADDSIASLAAKLNCPILSNDSDFHIYTSLPIIPLNNLEFREVQLKKDQGRSNGKRKVFAMITKTTPLRKICQKEFGLKDFRLLPLAAVVLGNDLIDSRIFNNFKGFKGGNKMNTSDRITKLFEWLGRETYESALSKLLASIKESNRGKIEDKIVKIVASYQGEGGDDEILNRVRNCTPLGKYLDVTEISKISSMLNERSESVDSNRENEIQSLVEELEEMNIKGDESLNEVEIDEMLDESFGFNFELNLLPSWVMDFHYKARFPACILTILHNKTILLPPQVEIPSSPSTHALAVPLLQVASGILLGDAMITLISRQRVQLERVTLKTKMPPTIPTSILDSSTSYKFSLQFSDRIKVFLETFKINEDQEAFVKEWPPALKYWIICILYYNQMKPQGERKRGISISLAVLISVLEHCLPLSNPHMAKPTDERKEMTISEIYQNSTMNIKFYKKMRAIRDLGTKKFMKSYQISHVYDFCQLRAVVYHGTVMLHVLGEPFKQPRFHWLNPFLIYNIMCKTVEQSIFDFLKKEIVENSPFHLLLLQFLEHLGWVEASEAALKVQKNDQTNAKKKKEKRTLGKNQTFNRFELLNTDFEHLTLDG